MKLTDASTSSIFVTISDEKGRSRKFTACIICADLARDRRGGRLEILEVATDVELTN